MDVDDLRLLEAVAAEGSFSRAAARLRFSQPSVSARIAAVERAIGAELFARDSRGARLTTAGERYLRYVRGGVGGGNAHPDRLLRSLADAATTWQLDLSIRAG